jgi:hypothetical protein
MNGCAVKRERTPSPVEVVMVKRERRGPDTGLEDVAMHGLKYFVCNNHVTNRGLHDFNERNFEPVPQNPCLPHKAI